MERYGHVLVKAFTERVDGPGLEAVVVNYKALHDQASGRSSHSYVLTTSLTDTPDQLQPVGVGLSTRTRNSLKTIVCQHLHSFWGGEQNLRKSFEARVTSAGPSQAFPATESWHVQCYIAWLTFCAFRRTQHQWLSCSA